MSLKSLGKNVSQISLRKTRVLIGGEPPLASQRSSVSYLSAALAPTVVRAVLPLLRDAKV